MAGHEAERRCAAQHDAAHRQAFEPGFAATRLGQHQLDEAALVQAVLQPCEETLDRRSGVHRDAADAGAGVGIGVTTVLGAEPAPACGATTPVAIGTSSLTSTRVT